jgi:light-independent protochlorophyllide reductase subunit B
VVAPAGRDAGRPANAPEADFNVVLYPEIAHTPRLAGAHLRQPMTKTVPIGVGATPRLHARGRRASSGVDPGPALIAARSTRLPWYSRSVDSTYLTGKRVFIFGDATHAIAAARIATDRAGLRGRRPRHLQPRVRPRYARRRREYGVEALITDDYLEVERRSLELRARAGARHADGAPHRQALGHPCAVISAPVHVQDFPARYSPQMGFEGANVLFDTWVHPLMMGLEEHLLGMFREDFEFSRRGNGPSHLGPCALARGAETQGAEARGASGDAANGPDSSADDASVVWTPKPRRN